MYIDALPSSSLAEARDALAPGSATDSEAPALILARALTAALRSRAALETADDAAAQAATRVEFDDAPTEAHALAWALTIASMVEFTRATEPATASTSTEPVSPCCSRDREASAAADQ